MYIKKVINHTQQVASVCEGFGSRVLLLSTPVPVTETQLIADKITPNKIGKLTAYKLYCFILFDSGRRNMPINTSGWTSVIGRNETENSGVDEDEDEEEWIKSGDSLDDIVINEVTDQETDDIVFQVEDLKVDDYILALFVSTGKRAVVHYRYVAKILQVLEGNDFEVQCLKSLDETKTTFKFIANDQCVIAKKEILERLPDPQLVQFGRILKTIFPVEVEVYEKS
ncbi:hypothetical protein FQA39_LY16129 [Lamprigera yunnana]|nr:hypothetical protein FQA39_LY16129 [Lamprigera yunnana]